MAELQLLTKQVQLSAEWEKSPKNLKAVQTMVDELKAAFLKFSFMPTSIDEKTRLDILGMQRNVLEISALLAIEKKDIPSFTRALAQIKHYYSELRNMDAEIGESERKYMMLGLNLMYLLAQHKLAEFHTELELLPQKVVAENVYISHPVKLEQYLMEGTYNKIFLSKANLPSPYYEFFMNILLDTVREEIGSCMAKGYKMLDLQEAARMLFFNDSATVRKDVLEYARQRNWNTDGPQRKFIFSDPDAGKKDDSWLDAENLAKNDIFYAKQLEMIV